MASLGDVLVAAALAYARARLQELRNEALTDADQLAQALGLGPFLDPPRGAIEGHLTGARDELDLGAGALGAADAMGAASHFAAALAHVDAAVTLAGGGSLTDFLQQAIDWESVVPTGLAAQLDLQRTPTLQVQDGALVFGIATAGPVALAPPPLAAGFRRASIEARLRLDGQAPPFSAALGLEGAEIGVGGGPIGALLAGAAGSVEADILVGVDTSNGLTLGGGVSHRIVLPARPKLPGLDVRGLLLELPDGVPDGIDIGASIAVSLGGVIQASVEGAGVRLAFDPAAVAAGANPVAVGLKTPSGIGLSLDSGIVRGGGYLDQRAGGFGGALQLRLGPVEVNAVGLLTLEPAFALVVVMSISFLPPIDLTFGFTLNRVGGIVGVEHRLDNEALRAGIASGALDHVLFPDDPVGAAPAILQTLELVFPVESGAIVIGPMVEIGWGRPVSFVTAQLGVILSLPDPLVVIIGRGRVTLPAPDLPIIDLRAILYGEITPDHLLILVSLDGSRIAGFAVGGDFGFLLRWSGGAEFAISAGGFHPRYQPPRELAGMHRLSMDLSPPAILQLRAESYFALTSNSVQLGAHVEMSADIGVADISGYFAFDALVEFAPRFMFLIDLGIGLKVHVFGETLCGVQIQLHLEGPEPWRAQGSAEVEVLWWSVSIDVGPFTWGDDRNPPPLPADPRLLVHAALDHNPGSWQAIVPPDADRVVRLRPAPASETDVTVHPMGLFDVRQHAVPLETVVARVGPNPVPDGQRRVHLGVPQVDGSNAGALSEVTELFSAGQFLDLTDDEKLSRPSFEPMPAGARIRPPGETAPFAASRQADLRYETFVCDDDAMIGKKSQPASDGLFTLSRALVLAAGAAGRSELRARSRYASAPDPIVLADAGEVLVRSKVTLAATASPVTGYTHAAETALAADLQLVRLGAG